MFLTFHALLNIYHQGYAVCNLFLFFFYFFILYIIFIEKKHLTHFEYNMNFLLISKTVTFT